ISTSGWLDAEGAAFTPVPWEQMNLLSMRGPWTHQGGPEDPVSGFDTTSDLFLFPETQRSFAFEKIVRSRDDAGSNPWFQWTQGCWYINPQPGRQYRVKAVGFGQATGGLEIRPRDGGNALASVSDLKIGEEAGITWPARPSITRVTVRARPGP